MLRRNRSRGSAVRRTNNHNNGGHNNGGRLTSDRGIYERPESRPRYGVASQNYERYMNQAKEALGSGDRVQAEYYYQHADHFLRILNEYREQRESQQVNHAAQHQEVAPCAENEAVGQTVVAERVASIEVKQDSGLETEGSKQPRRPARRQRPKGALSESNKPAIEAIAGAE